MGQKHDFVNIPLNVKINVTHIERNVRESIDQAFSDAQSNVNYWLKKEVTSALEREMKKALREVLKVEIAKAIK